MEQGASDSIGRDRRGAARTSVMLLGEVSHACSSGPARITNVSESGASLSGANLPPAGFWVDFRRGEVAMLGRVVWLSKGRAGLQFDKPLEASSFRRPVCSNGSRYQARCRRSPLNPRHLTRVEREEIRRYATIIGVQAAI